VTLPVGYIDTWIRMGLLVSPKIINKILGYHNQLVIGKGLLPKV
jgi:hypothetical protein